MRIPLLDRRQLRQWLGGCAASLALALPAAAQSVPSFSATISADAPETWSGDTATVLGAPPASEYDLAPLPADSPAAAAAGAPCESCNGGDGSSCGGFPYNRCGCSSHALFPWFTGPGTCDNWCVGPHWEVAVDGLIMFREDAELAAIPLDAGYELDLIDQFDHGPGARVFVTGYNDSDFGLQVGYEGVNDFHARALSSLPDDADALPPDDADFIDEFSRDIAYESRFNSLEVNFLRRTDFRWKPFAGVRYFELDEDLVDRHTEIRPLVELEDATPYTDTFNALLLDNRMIGLQGGVFRDVWRLNRWVSIEPFGNAGVYLNDFRRRTRTENYVTVIQGDDLTTPENERTEVTNVTRAEFTQEFTELAFVGEAGVTGVLRITPCVALRGGYQVLAVNGVGTAVDGFLNPGLDPDTLVYHGGHFGVEYVR
jgi:hypothetical protein